MLRLSASRIVGLAALAAVLLGLAGWRYRLTRPAYRLAYGQQLARTGDFIKAERYALSLEGAGETDRCLLLRGEMQFLQRDPQRALSTLSRIKDVGALGVDAAFLSARCLIALSNASDGRWRLREAEQLLVFVGNERPDHVDARRELAAIYYDQGDLSRALTLAEQIADLDPRDAKSSRLMGQIFKDTDQPAAAAKALRESLRRDPNPADLAEVRVDLAECLFKLGKHQEVLDLLGQDGSPAAVSVRVETMIAVGQIDEASALLDQALVQSPDHSGLLQLRGESYRANGDPAAAANLLERVVAKRDNPYDFRSHHQLALCYAELARIVHGRFDFLENLFRRKGEDHQRLVEGSQELLVEMHSLQKQAMKDPWNERVRLRLADLSAKLGLPELEKMWRLAAEACRQPR